MSDNSRRKQKRAIWRRFNRFSRPSWTDFNANWTIDGEVAYKRAVQDDK